MRQRFVARPIKDVRNEITVIMHTTSLNIPELVPLVVGAALRCVEAQRPKKKRTPGAICAATIGTVMIVYLPPNGVIATSSHQLQIWKDRKSVLLTTWDDEGSRSCKTLDFCRGAWVDEIVDAAEFFELKAGVHPV